MILWLDAQLPPALALFLNQQFDLEVLPLREIGLRDAQDSEIFEKARKQDVVLVSKDTDFVEMIQRLGSPPRLLWVTCGNTTNDHLCKLFGKLMPEALSMLKNGEQIIEIGDELDV